MNYKQLCDSLFRLLMDDSQNTANAAARARIEAAASEMANASNPPIVEAPNNGSVGGFYREMIAKAKEGPMITLPAKKRGWPKGKKRKPAAKRGRKAKGK